MRPVERAAPALAETYDFPVSAWQTPISLRIEGSGDIEAIGPLIRDFQSLNPQFAITYVDTLTNELYARIDRGLRCRREACRTWCFRPPSTTW